MHLASKLVIQWSLSGLEGRLFEYEFKALSLSLHDTKDRQRPSQITISVHGCSVEWLFFIEWAWPMPNEVVDTVTF